MSSWFHFQTPWIVIVIKWIKMLLFGHIASKIFKVFVRSQLEKFFFLNLSGLGTMYVT